MEQTPRGVKVKPTIGIGFTTYKRDNLLAECLDNLRLYTTSDYKLHIARDSDEDRRGIALRKNECLHHLQDCDYIFLFDDDCYPIKKGWEQFVIKAHEDSGEHHFAYLKDNIHTAKNFYFCGDTTTKSFVTCGGVFLSITKECLKKVGGFWDNYDLYGFEHLGYSFRVFSAKLNSDLFMSVEGLEEYLFAYDYEEKNFQSTIPLQERIDMSEKGKKIFELDAQVIYKPIVYEKK
jgi:glycosyltransferase involved in cell wall biosynthesis